MTARSRGHFGRAKTGSLVRRLALWVSQDVDVVEYVRSCQTCQRTKAEHGGPRGLLHPLPLPWRRGGMIRVGRVAGSLGSRGGKKQRPRRGRGAAKNARGR